MPNGCRDPASLSRMSNQIWQGHMLLLKIHRIFIDFKSSQLISHSGSASKSFKWKRVLGLSPVLNCNAKTMVTTIFWCMWQLAQTIISQKHDFGEFGNEVIQKINALSKEKEKFCKFSCQLMHLPSFGMCSSPHFCTNKINQTAKLDQLKGISSSMARIVPPLCFSLICCPIYCQTFVTLYLKLVKNVDQMHDRTFFSC